MGSLLDISVTFELAKEAVARAFYLATGIETPAFRKSQDRADRQVKVLIDLAVKFPEMTPEEIPFPPIGYENMSAKKQRTARFESTMRKGLRMTIEQRRKELGLT